MRTQGRKRIFNYSILPSLNSNKSVEKSLDPLYDQSDGIRNNNHSGNQIMRNFDFPSPISTQISSSLFPSRFDEEYTIPQLINGSANFRRYKRFPQIWGRQYPQNFLLFNNEFKNIYIPDGNTFFRSSNNFQEYRNQLALNYKKEALNKINNTSRSSSPRIEKIRNYAIRGQDNLNSSNIKVKTLINQRIQLDHLSNLNPSSLNQVINEERHQLSHRMVPSSEFLPYPILNNDFEIKRQKAWEYSRQLDAQVI